MHNAPSVSYPVGRSLWAVVLPGVAWAAGLLCTATWILHADAAGPRHALAILVLGVVGAGALHAWWRSPRGELCWDGEAWQWSAAADHLRVAVELEPRLDLQGVLMLHVRRAGRGAGVAWLWLDRSSRPQHWDALRRAVYSPARAPLPEAQPPAATP